MNICLVNDCKRIHYAKGYCRAHWSRVYKHGKTDSSPIKLRVDGFRPCERTNCPNRFYARGLCQQHYEELKRQERPIYKIWVNMRQRCNNPKNPKYKDYGGRGIKVCERWDSFALFLKDMGERPVGHSIDRIDVNGNYEPDNCRWATAKLQRANQR